MEYISTQTASKKWNISERRITQLCREGKIANARKEGKLWMIPEDAAKPVDRRKRLDSMERFEVRKPLPIGISDYKKAVSDYYYVDKTLMIRDFLDQIPQVSLFTRPRRFGKTLNMDMLRTFFEISEENTAIYFQDKKIWQCGEFYTKHQGKYPVISISFKDVKFKTWEETLQNIALLLTKEYNRHCELADSDKCQPSERAYYQKVVNGEANLVELTQALANLSLMLDKHYEVAPIIIIDEYDTPIQQGYLCGFYDEVTSFIRNLFSGGLKDNRHLSYGFLTGILRVAKESIFSGLNNLSIYSVLEKKYDSYFGFTAEEVKQITAYYGVEDKYTEICEWYDGYRFGKTDIFNPWSVSNYIANECDAKAFWQSTADNGIITQIIEDAPEELLEDMQKLMQGQTISSYIDPSVIYPEIEENPSSVYSFLLSSGYLKSVQSDSVYDGSLICNLSIPNKEIFCVYEKEIMSAYSGHFKQSTSIALRQALLRQDIQGFQKYLQTFLIDSISSFDYAHENFYHGLMLGIYAVMNHIYQITSNRESGLGRYDIQMKPRKKNYPGIVIELKVPNETIANERIEERLKELSEAAIRQIDDREYVREMKKDGVERIMKIGIAFYKKQVRLAWGMEG